MGSRWIAVLLLGISWGQAEEAVSDEVIVREQNLSHLEGRAPPALVAERWMNTSGEEALELEQLKGKVVLIDFWGTWCRPCRATIPYLKELHEAFVDDGLVIIGIHSTQNSRDMERFVRKEEIPYAVAVDQRKITWKAYQGDSYPDYFLIDRKGVLRFADLETTSISDAVLLLLKEEVE